MGHSEIEKKWIFSFYNRLHFHCSNTWKTDDTLTQLQNTSLYQTNSNYTRYRTKTQRWIVENNAEKISLHVPENAEIEISLKFWGLNEESNSAWPEIWADSVLVDSMKSQLSFQIDACMIALQANKLEVVGTLANQSASLKHQFENCFRPEVIFVRVMTNSCWNIILLAALLRTIKM